MTQKDQHRGDSASGAITRSDYDDAYTACKADPAGCDRDAVKQLAAEIDDVKRPRVVLSRAGCRAQPRPRYRNVRLSDGDSPRKIQLGMAELLLLISTR